MFTLALTVKSLPSALPNALSHLNSSATNDFPLASKCHYNLAKF